MVNTTIAKHIAIYDECPNCGEGEHRWIYKCTECEFEGCYDGVYNNGCYTGLYKDEQQCPECNGNTRIIIGKVGKGSVEETT